MCTIVTSELLLVGQSMVASSPLSTGEPNYNRQVSGGEIKHRVGVASRVVNLAVAVRQTNRWQPLADVSSTMPNRCLDRTVRVTLCHMDSWHGV
jgi:hypothetical protein